MVDLGMIIKNMRLSSKLSQLELAKQLALARTTISSYEINNSEPDFNTLLKICKICGYEFILLKDGKKIVVPEWQKESRYEICSGKPDRES